MAAQGYMQRRNPFRDIVTRLAAGIVTVGAAGVKLANGRTVESKSGDTVSVKDFSAIGDGTTDDTTALTNAINTLNGSGGRLRFPPGSYKISSQLPDLNNLTLYGDAGGYRANGPLITQTHASAPIIATTAGARSSIAGLRLFGQTTTSKLVTLAGIDSIKSCYLNNCAGEALLLANTSIACTVEDIVVLNAVIDRSGSTQTGGVSIDGTDHWLSRIEVSVESGQGSSVSANKVAVAILIAGANHFCADLIGEFGEVGILVTAAKSRFTSCRADRCMGDGWTVSGGSNIFIGCHAMECGTVAANTYDGFICSGTGNTWIAPMVASQGSAQLRYGMRDTLVSNTLQQKNIWLAPRVLQAVGTAKYNWGASQSSAPTFGRVVIRATANATTIDVTEADVIDLQLYTTPTTVTNFTNGYPGQIITLLGDADVTIQNNTNIKTKSGSDIVCTATSAHQFVTLSGAIWREV